MKNRPRKTITLVEALIIFAILAILSLVIVPEFGRASVDVREITLQVELQRLREQIASYRQEHDGLLPEADKFIAQLTMRTNKAGKVMPPHGSFEDYPLGPYMERIPRNPYVNRRVADRVEIGRGRGGDGNAGWYFSPETGVISPDDDFHCDR